MVENILIAATVARRVTHRTSVVNGVSTFEHKKCIRIAIFKFVLYFKVVSFVYVCVCVRLDLLNGEIDNSTAFREV